MRLLTVTELAQRTGWTPVQIRRLIVGGAIPCARRLDYRDERGQLCRTQWRIPETWLSDTWPIEPEPVRQRKTKASREKLNRARAAAGVGPFGGS